MTWKIPFFDLQLEEEEKAAVRAVLDDNWLTSGPRVQAFEADFARAWGIPADQAVAVTNCTAALHLALAALGVGPGDEVICPSLTFVATANTARYLGARPVFADVISEDDWTIDPDDVAAKITPGTKAIMVVHYGGHACDMARLTDLAEAHGLAIVEDACHGPLGRSQGRMLGLIGEVGCFSFFGNKNLTTGEGGMLVTRDPEIAERVRVMRSHGMTKTSFERYQGGGFGYDVTALGYNYRMDEMRAALGIEQLKKLPDFNRARLERVAHYRRCLGEANTSCLTVPFSDRQDDPGCHLFPILLADGGKDRDAVMADLARDGIQTSIHYRPVHTLSAYADDGSALPVTERIAPRILSLPLFPGLRARDVEHISDRLRKSIASGERQAR